MISSYSRVSAGSLIDAVIMDAFKCDLFTLVGKLKRDLDLNTVALLFYSILRTVQFMHERSYVHGDLVPYNILLDKELSPILSDLSCYMIDYSDTHFDEQSFRGSTHSRPPEIRHAASTLGMKDFDPFKADVWGLGVILYNLLYGTRPYTA